jgi:hypothetical protein
MYPQCVRNRFQTVELFIDSNCRPDITLNSFPDNPLPLKEGWKASSSLDSYASEFARKGGKARARKLTEEQRKESARRAAQARWAKREKS